MTSLDSEPGEDPSEEEEPELEEAEIQLGTLKAKVLVETFRGIVSLDE